MEPDHLLAMRMGKQRIIAETGAGQHGVATATVCARYGLPCVVYMGAVDVERQAQPNVQRMQLLVRRGCGRSRSGSATLKDATKTRRCATGSPTRWTPSTSSARWWVRTLYPQMVRDLQRSNRRVESARAQILEAEGRLPDAAVACVGGGSNAIGLFHAFLDDDVEAVRG